MVFQQLTPREKELIRECLAAIAQGPFIDDAECHSRLGITRTELNAVLARWPHLDDTEDSSDDSLAINNCLNEICHGVLMSDSQWRQCFSGTQAEISAVFAHWRHLKGFHSTGLL